MPNIDSYLAKIREAVYGEEVRGSIHDALAVINDEVDDSEQVALKRSIASTYSSSSSYAVGDYVFYPGSATDGVLYKCVVNIPTGEAWNSSHWTAVTLSSDLKDTAVCRFFEPPANVTSCDDVTKNSWYFNSIGGGTSTFSDFPFNAPGFLQTIVFNQQAYQMAVNWSTNVIKQRIRKHGTWGTWTDIAVGDGINEKIGLIDRLAASNELGININKARGIAQNSGITYEWDDDIQMYHIHGSSLSTSSIYNIYVNDFGLPDGMKPGGTYWICPIKDDIYAPAETDTVSVQCFINKNTSTANWELMSGCWINNGVSKLTTPSDAVGFLVRYNIQPNKTVDFYSKVAITSISRTPLDEKTDVKVCNSNTPYGNSFYPSSGSCSDIAYNSVMFNSFGGGTSTFSDFPLSEPGWIWTYKFDGNDAQFVLGWTTGTIKYRLSHFGTWQDWIGIGMDGSALQSCDLDDVWQESAFYLLTDDQTYEHKPLESMNAGFLSVWRSANWTLQIYYHLADNRVWKRTISNGSVRYDWVQMGGGGGPTYNITQEINRDEIANTYNITTSPTITTDTNNYLQAIDNESTPESSATDMTGAIMSMLNSTGHCKLGPGVFYVSGSIDMPNGSSIEGCGNKTIVRLLSSVSSGYILRIEQYSTVKDIHFSGGTSIPANLYTDGTNMGSRHGIYMIANADGHEAAQPATAQCEITNCWFDNFDGSAFYAHNTGGGLHNSVIFSDSHIEHCRVGLNIDYYNEYAKYSHLVIFQCYYACINNGGNNIFTGCTFHGVVGWLTDNSNNDKSNNQHGSCIGCTFNHIDNMNHPDVLGNGKAVHIINGVAGFIFTGCQLWYGNVYIENSQGVQFSDCLFGNNRIEVEVTGSYPAFFFNNIFWTQPTLNVTTNTVFKDNYLKTGVAVTP